MTGGILLDDSPLRRATLIKLFYLGYEIAPRQLVRPPQRVCLNFDRCPALKQPNQNAHAPIGRPPLSKDGFQICQGPRSDHHTVAWIQRFTQ